MARREARPRAERERVLRPLRRCCPGCGRRMPIRYGAERHLRSIAERGRMGWRKASGYDRRALAEAAISRHERAAGAALRSRTGRRQAAEVAIAARALNRMLELGRPESVRIA
jgi:hypothetical protein